MWRRHPVFNIRQVMVQEIKNQEVTKKRLDILEKNQDCLLQNQGILSNAQSCLQGNQQNIYNKIDQNVVTKTEMMAQAKLILEMKVGLKNVETGVCRMTGVLPDKKLDEVAGILPLHTTSLIKDVEEKLEEEDFSKAMTTYLYKIKLGGKKRKRSFELPHALQ